MIFLLTVTLKVYLFDSALMDMFLIALGVLLALRIVIKLYELIPFN